MPRREAIGCHSRIPAVLLLAALVTLPSGAQADTDDDPGNEQPQPGVGVWRAELDGLAVREIVLPDEPLHAAPWPSGGLAVLAVEVTDDGAGERGDGGERDETPRTLYRLRGQASDLEPVARGLDPAIDAVAAVGDALWLGGDGALWRLAPDGELRLVIEQAGADLRAMLAGGLLPADATADGQILVPDVGSLHHFDRDGRRLGRTPLPVRADRRRRSLSLRSPGVTRLADSTLVAGPLAAGPTRGEHRLLTAGQDASAWTRLPRPEDVEAHWYDLLGDEPVFLAATTEADRLRVFEKLQLRIFRLRPDRTRAGRTPLFEVESETLHWYRFEPSLVDWTGDGRQDLLLVQPEGRDRGDLVVDLFEARAGRFSPTPRRSKLDAEAATWHLGEDFDGDGRPDLVVATGALEIYRGVDHRRRVVDKDPWRRIDRRALRQGKEAIATLDEPGPITDQRVSFRGRVRVADLDGDGRPEIAIVRRQHGRGLIRLVDIEP